MSSVRKGTVVVPPGAYPEDHEIATAKALAALGHTVEFIVPNDGYKIKSPDIFMDGLAWEIKSPTSRSKSSLSRHIKTALKQSRCIIIDSSRTKLGDEIMEKALRKDVKTHTSTRRLKMITKQRTVLDIK